MSSQPSIPAPLAPLAWLGVYSRLAMSIDSSRFKTRLSLAFGVVR